MLHFGPHGFKRGRVKVKEFSDSVNKVCGQIIREGARVWLRTLLNHITGAPYTKGDSFPIFSGEAKSSLAPLGRFLRVAVPLGSRPSYILRDKSGRVRIIRPPNNTSAGQHQQYFTIVDDTRSTKFKYSFEFSTLVEHFEINETEHVARVRSQTPWSAFFEAELAFLAYIEIAVPKRLPKVEEYMEFF